MIEEDMYEAGILSRYISAGGFVVLPPDKNLVSCRPAWARMPSESHIFKHGINQMGFPAVGDAQVVPIT